MRRAVVTLLLGLAGWLAWNGLNDPAHAQTAPPSPASRATGTPGATPPTITAAAIDTFAAERDSLMDVVLKQIAGREQAPAESVFKNIEVLKGVPAARVPRIMNIGFGRSLGVRCAHCHVAGKWDLEDKPQKQVARDMMALSHVITDSLLAKIPNLRSQKPTVNCTTCHRGSIKPALNL